MELCLFCTNPLMSGVMFCRCCWSWRARLMPTCSVALAVRSGTRPLLKPSWMLREDISRMSMVTCCPITMTASVRIHPGCWLCPKRRPMHGIWSVFRSMSRMRCPFRLKTGSKILGKLWVSFHMSFCCWDRDNRKVKNWSDLKDL